MGYSLGQVNKSFQQHTNGCGDNNWTERQLSCMFLLHTSTIVNHDIIVCVGFQFIIASKAVTV